MSVERDEVIDLDIPEEEESKLRNKEIERISGKPDSKIFGSVPDKLIRDLTIDERTLLIKNFTDKVENDNFNVKQLKNGNYSITRKRNGKVKSMNEEIIKDVTKTPGKVGHLTTEQFMIQNFLEMDRKLERERLKRKQLKKKYRKMKSDIYEDTDNEKNELIVESKSGESSDETDENDVKSDEDMKNEDEKVENHVTQSYKVDESPTIRRKLTLRETLMLSRR